MALDTNSIKGALGKALKGELPEVSLTAEAVTLSYSPEMHAARCSIDAATIRAMTKCAHVTQVESPASATPTRVTVTFHL